MPRASAQKVVIIGAGNLAWHLARKLSGKKHDLHIYNHRPWPKLRRFKKLLNCSVHAGLSGIEPEADCYFICVKDEAIRSVSAKLKVHQGALLIHMSGSKPLSEIRKTHANRAVIYPLQTFSEKDEVNWEEIPLLVEANNKNSLQKALKLARSLSAVVIRSNCEQRQNLHLAAVFVNNFTNALYSAAYYLLKNKGRASDFKLLQPLIRQGLTKLEKMTPPDAQTGPAKRGDQNVMDHHLRLLTSEPALRELYAQMSRLIAAQQDR